MRTGTQVSVQHIHLLEKCWWYSTWELTETPKYEKSRKKSVFYLKSTSHHIYPKDFKRTRSLQSLQKTAEKRRISGFSVLLRSFANFCELRVLLQSFCLISISVLHTCHYHPLVKWIMTAFLKPRTMH